MDKTEQGEQGELVSASLALTPYNIVELYMKKICTPLPLNGTAKSFHVIVQGYCFYSGTLKEKNVQCCAKLHRSIFPETKPFLILISDCDNSGRYSPMLPSPSTQSSKGC